MQKSDIKVRMTEEQAIKIIDEIKNNICDVDLDEICGDKADIGTKDIETAKIYKKVIQAVRCGLVEWSEEENCMIQHLIRPLKCGTLEVKDLYYKNDVKFGDSREYRSNNQSDVMIQTLANITAKPTQLIEELRGQDLLISIGCMGFFDR